MPTIPNVTDIERANPSGQQRVVRMGDVDSGLTSFGEDLSSVARNIKTVEDADRQHALDSADVAARVSLEEIGNDYDNDPDFETVGERSEQRMTESINAIAEGISNPADRARWIEAQQLQQARTRTRLGKVVAVKRRDHARAGINEDINSLRRAALTSEDMPEMVALADRQLESAVAAGHLTAQEAEKYGRDFRSSVAVDRLDRLPPDQLTAALSEDWAKNIPVEDQIRLENKARVEGVKITAVDNVDQLYADNPDATLEDGLAMTDEIEDKAEREATETRLRRVHADKENADTERMNDNFEEAAKLIMDGGTLDDVPLELIDDMTATQRGNLTNLDAERSGAERTVSDPDVYDLATEYAAQGDWGALRSHISRFGSMLKPTDRQSFSDAAAEGTAPATVTYQQMIQGKLPATDDTSAEARKILLPRISQWANDYRAAHEKEPSQAEVEKEIDRRLSEVNVVDGGWLWLDSSEPIYSLGNAKDRDNQLERLHLTELRARYGAETYDNAADYMRSQPRGVNRHGFERMVRTQAEIDNLRKRQNPDLQEVIKDVDEYFQAQGTTPTQTQWLDAVSKVQANRNAP